MVISAAMWTVSTGVLHGIRAVMARQQWLISRTGSYLALPTLHQKTWSRCQDRQRDRTLRTHTMYPSHVLATLDTVALLVSVEMPATGEASISMPGIPPTVSAVVTAPPCAELSPSSPSKRSSCSI